MNDLMKLSIRSTEHLKYIPANSEGLKKLTNLTVVGGSGNPPLTLSTFCC